MPKTKSKAASTKTKDDELGPRKFLKQESLTLRLDEPTMRHLSEVAVKKGLGVSTVARMLMLQGLSKEDPPSFGNWV